MLTLTFEMLEALLSVLGELSQLARSSLSSRLSGSFPYPEKPFQATLRKDRGVLRSRHTGFCLNGHRCLSAEGSYRGALIVGGTGTGKTSNTILPSLLRMSAHGHSFVVHDPSGEIAEAAHGHLDAMGHDVRLIRYDRASASDGFNPLRRVTGDIHVGRVSDTLVRAGLAGGQAGDPFWESQARHLLAFLIEVLTRQRPEHRNMANLIALLNAVQDAPRKLKTLVPVDAARLHRELRGLANLSERVLSGTVATVKAALAMFHNREIQRVTGFDTAGIEELRARPTAIFIQNPVMSQRFFAPLTSLFFTQLFEHLMRRLPGPGDRSVFCLVDEAASFSADWPLYLSQVRKYRVGILLAVQSFEQLKQQYSPFDAHTIAANCHAKMYFTNQEHETARELSDSLGHYTLTGPDGRTGRRPLLAPQEIRMMRRDRALLFVGNRPPILTRLRPYYASRLRRLVRPAPAVPSRIPFDEVPLLPL